MKVAVVGRGLFGSAAARHLAKAGLDVLLIGPSEPVDKRDHHGVFGSHYDEGRITRKAALSPFWVQVSKAAIGRYAEIEAESGIRFFTEAGAMMAGQTSFMDQVQIACATHDVSYEALGGEDLARRFPYFKMPASFTATYEATLAGHVSPRRLVAAQAEAARRHGARVIDETVLDIRDDGTGASVVTGQGSYQCDQVLVAAGGMTDVVLGRSPTLDVYARTVALFRLPASEVARLQGMPALVYQAPESPYLLPPITYPDGQTHLKLGGDPEDVRLDGPEAIGDWFRSGGNAEVRDRLEDMVRELMPDLTIESVKMDACVTTWTQDRLPEIARLSGAVSVCTGGNGAGAKCSDELGRLGAALICDEIGVSI